MYPANLPTRSKREGIRRRSENNCCREVGAHYGEFVQLERLKKNGRFGGKRTAGLVMPNGAVSAMPCEAMLLSMVVWLG
jgi:hypothetical protein